MKKKQAHINEENDQTELEKYEEAVEKIKTAIRFFADNIGIRDAFMGRLCTQGTLVTKEAILFLAFSVHDVNETYRDGNTFLVFTCYDLRFTEAVEILLKDPRVDVNKGNGRGCTPLWAACSIGNTEAVKLLLKHPNIDVNKIDGDGQTAFAAAVFAESHEVLDLLLKDPRIDMHKILINIINIDDAIYGNLFYIKIAEALHKAVERNLLPLTQDTVNIDSLYKNFEVIRKIKYIFDPSKSDTSDDIFTKAASEIKMLLGVEKVNDIKEKIKLSESYSIMFTMILLLSGGYLEKKDTSPEQMNKFFKIVEQMPEDIKKLLEKVIFDVAIVNNAVDVVEKSIPHSFDDSDLLDVDNHLEAIGDSE